MALSRTAAGIGTAVAALVAGGALEYAGTLLGSPFVVDGPVAHGDKRGRTLGYPTANLVPREGYARPGHGVYACRVRTADGRWHAAATNVGVRPMFESGLGELIEAFLLDRPVCLNEGVWHDVFALSDTAVVKIAENLDVGSEFYDLPSPLVPRLVAE